MELFLSSQRVEYLHPVPLSGREVPPPGREVSPRNLYPGREEGSPSPSRHPCREENEVPEPLLRMDVNRVRPPPIILVGKGSPDPTIIIVGKGSSPNLHPRREGSPSPSCHHPCREGKSPNLYSGREGSPRTSVPNGKGVPEPLFLMTS